MNVGQLKQILLTIPDDTVIVAPTRNHTFSEVSCAASTGLRTRYGWDRDYGEENTPESSNAKRMPVFVVCSDWD